MICRLFSLAGIFPDPETMGNLWAAAPDDACPVMHCTRSVTNNTIGWTCEMHSTPTRNPTIGVPDTMLRARPFQGKYVHLGQHVIQAITIPNAQARFRLAQDLDMIDVLNKPVGSRAEVVYFRPNVSLSIGVNPIIVPFPVELDMRMPVTLYLGNNIFTANARLISYGYVTGGDAP